MLLDQQNIFSDAQVVAATGVSTNIIDAGAAICLGSGRRVVPLLNISAVAGTNPTLTADLEGADDAAFAVNKKTIATVTPTLTTGMAQQNVGFPLPARHTPKRYYRINYTLGGTGSPSVTITSGFVMDEQSNPAPPINP